jgi:YHS domain-containing protein
MFSGCFRFPGLWCVTLGASLGATLAPLARADAPPPATLVADAVIPWHADLAAATQAALVSHRPALVVFLAGSSESGAALSRDVFPAAETVALLTACFEPVRVDVDIDPSAARALGITQVPTACIVDGQQRLLARFDCPTTPAAFVAAASRAAQEAATVRVAGAVTPAAAIREQSDFVKQAAQPALQPTAQPLVAAPAAAPPADTAHAEEPSLPMTPPAWPAEPASRPMPFMPDSQAAAPARSAIEPATTAPNAIASAPAAPWLTAPAAPVAPAAPTAVAASPATPAAPAAPPATPPAAPPAAEPEKKSASSQFLAALQKPFTVFSKPKTDAALTPPATPAPGSAVAATPPPAAAPDPYGSMPLGLEGYCPVSLIDKGTWVEGRAQWGARHRGRTYLFAGAEQQRAFLATPDRYAPALSGDDPVLACDTGKQVAGQRRFGVTYQSRTYLFSSPETRTAFAANPQRYTTRVVIAERPAAPDTVVR